MATNSTVIPHWQWVNSRVVTTTLDGLPQRAHWRTWLYSTIFFLLAASHTLLPIERGIPVIRLAADYPVTIIMIESFVCFLCLTIESGGTIFRSIAKVGYLRWQCLFTALLAVAAITSPEPKAAFFVVLNYGVCFILNFVILRYLFMQGSRQAMLVIVCITASAAAVIGLLERAGYYLPFYRNILLSFDYWEMNFAMNQTGDLFRVLGPVGNPILYAVVLSLALPFALNIRGGFKWMLAVLLGVSVLLSTSTTGFMMLGIYALGKLAVYVRKFPLFTVLACSCCGIAGAALVANGVVDMADVLGPYQRLIFGDERNTTARLEMIDVGLSRMLTFDDVPVLLSGRGLKTSIEVESHASNGNTLDNVWLTIGYEAGIPAVFIYFLLQISVLYQLRRFVGTPHWWGILAWCAAGVSFVTIYYATTSFLWVALVAWLWTAERRFDGGRIPACAPPGRQQAIL